MAEWISCPDNNPWTLPDGARIRTMVEGTRHTVRVPQNPWLPSGYTGAHIDLENLNECTWEYWSEDAPESPSEFVAGFEAAAAEGRWLVRRAQLLGWLRLVSAVAAVYLLAAMASADPWRWVFGGSAVAAVAVWAVLAVRISRMDREARRG